MPKAAPRPIFGFFAQSAFNRIAMNIAELSPEVGVAANVAVVVALLPEMSAVNVLPGDELPVFGG